MKVSTVILGASCYSAGLLSGDPESDCIVVERGASVGGEYFNSFRCSYGWDSPYRSDAGTSLYRQLAERGAFKTSCGDFFALAPLLYRELIPLSERLRLTTEVTAITVDGSGFRIELYNQDGRSEICCDRLIDTRLSANSHRIAVRKLNCAVFLETPGCPAFHGFSSWPGRNEQEMFLSLVLEPGADWIMARRELINRFAGEPERGEARIAAIAKEFDYEISGGRETAADGRVIINPLDFANPLAAFDAGAAAAATGRW